MEISKETLLQFAANNKTDDRIMKLEKDGITYIYKARCTFDDDPIRCGKAELIGLVADNTFYGIGYFYCDIDKDFQMEVNAFEDEYNRAYEEYISQYSIDNLAPITEHTQIDKYRSVEQRLNEYVQYDLRDDVIRKSFEGVDNNAEIMHEYHTDEFSPMFIKYLVSGNEYLNEQIRQQAEVEAETINLRILKNAERIRLTKELANDPDLTERIELYKKLKECGGKTVKMALDIDGTVIDGLKIAVPQLCNALKYRKGELSEYFFTANERDTIRKAWKTCKPYDGKEVRRK